MSETLVIGAGPAGLMAAEELATAGHRVQLVDAKPSVGRKFLMAGKSGLNLTKNEDTELFLSRYADHADPLRQIIAGFDPGAVQDWCRNLGQEVFTGSSGRVFPKSMKASPLLRAWLLRLQGLDVQINTRWRWTGWSGDAVTFQTPDGPVNLCPKRLVLALGGASWPRLGSDGGWAPILQDRGVALMPFAAANVGLRVTWSAHMQRFYGVPVKGVELSASATRSRGEFVISASGLEGGGVYSMTSPVRSGAELTLDLLPDWSLDRVSGQLAKQRKKVTLANHLRKALHLNPAKIALLMEFGRPLPGGDALAGLLKSLPIKHAGPGPIEDAISTAGGVSWGAVDEQLMLKQVPGVFVAGEMLDWEAPTGGYLINACLATGKWAGHHAAGWD